MLIFIFIKSLKSIENKGTKNFIFITIIISIFCIIQANFTMAVLFLIVSLTLSFVPTNMSRKKILIVCIISGSIIACVAKPLLASLLEHLDNYYTSIYMRMKIEKLIEMLNGDGNLSDATSRIYLIGVSIKNFLNYPLLGKGIYFHDFSIIGGHSQILDDLARYGIIGYTIIVIPIINFFKDTLKKLNKSNQNIYIILIGLYIGLSFFNVSLPYYISIVVFTIIPIWMNKFNDIKEG